jgi:hypothetical protein
MLNEKMTVVAWGTFGRPLVWMLTPVQIWCGAAI